MVYSLDEIKSRIMPIVKQYGIPAIYLFGSYARGDANENSDIDLLVDTTGTNLTSLFQLGALYDDLEVALEKRIDLITMQAIMQPSTMESDHYFRETVMKERMLLHDVA